MIEIHVTAAENLSWVESAITLGAVLLGGAITYGTTYLFERSRNRDRNLSLAYQLVFNVQKMSDDLSKLNAHISHSIQTADSIDAKMPLWSKIIDIVGFTDTEISLSAEELALVATTKNAEMVMALREVESSHAIAMKSFMKLCALKNELGSKDIATHAEGQTVSFEISSVDYPKIAPLIINLDTLAQSFVSALPRMTENAKVTAEKLGPLLKEKYKFKHFVELKFEKQP